ncbi:MAG: SCO family protein [Erythrobacter sp.]
MNHNAKPYPKFAVPKLAGALAAGALALLAGCSAEAPPGPSPDGVDLRGAAIGGDFTLTSHTGEAVSWDDFTGQYRLVYFGFTYCPDICPTDIQRISQGLGEFEKASPDLAAKVQPIFITVDPERDDVAVMREFVGNFHPRLIGLTGTRDEIDAAKQAFGVSATKDAGGTTQNYNITHTTFTYLFDPDGAPLGVIPTDKQAGGVAAELAQWVR